MSTRMPAFYKFPLGLPFHWRDEVSGQLPAAIDTFLHRKPLAADQVDLIRDYLKHYINAPCWETETMEEDFAFLRESVDRLMNSSDISGWIMQALEVGCDPL